MSEGVGGWTNTTHHMLEVDQGSRARAEVAVIVWDNSPVGIPRGANSIQPMKHDKN